MSEYIWIFIWIGALAFARSMKEFRKTELVCGQPVLRYPIWYAVLMFAPIIWIAGNRGWVGDTWAYLMQYKDLPQSLLGIPGYLATVDKDKGFTLLSMIIKLFARSDTKTYLTIIAIMQGAALIAIYRKYSIGYVISVFLFVASTDYVSWMMNGMRQFLAVTIIFSATGLMLKKKYVPLILVILLASTIHQSALIMIPITIIAQGKAWNRKTLLFIAGTLLALMFIGQFTNLLEDSLADTQYSNAFLYVNDYGDNGTNPIRVLVFSIPTILAFRGRKIIKETDDPVIHICTNMSIICMGLYLISMVTSGVTLGRLPIFVSLYNYILLPWEIEHLFSRKSRDFVCLVLIGAYLFYYYYQMHISWGLL